jgi:thioredoxin reductase
VELSENEEHVHLYYNGELIRSHQITAKRLNYHQEDLVQILKSDVMSHKEEDEIQEHIKQSMRLYDLLEDETDE